MKRKDKTWIRRGAYIVFGVYIISLIYFLFFSGKYGRTGGVEGYPRNFELFKEIKRFIIYRNQIGMKSCIVNVAGNILAFVPFGFIFPIISPKNRKFFNILVLTLEFTITVELFQLILKVGIFDVDDIFLNTIGGIVGYVLLIICQKLLKKK